MDRKKKSSHVESQHSFFSKNDVQDRRKNFFSLKKKSFEKQFLYIFIKQLQFRYKIYQVLVSIVVVSLKSQSVLQFALNDTHTMETSSTILQHWKLR